MKEYYVIPDVDSYYLGELKSKNKDWLTVEAVDEDGCYGGIHFIRKSAVKVKEKSKEIDFLLFLIKKVFYWIP